MFERPHHKLIAQVLNALDAQVLRDKHCLFGGGTAIALCHGEYRESVDMDFLVSDIDSYRFLRQLLTGPTGIQAIAKAGNAPLKQVREIRADQYGIRTLLSIADQNIKFEIVLEGRIPLEPPSGKGVCGIATLTPLDMMTTKLLANSDRWRDEGVFSRDLIDLAMMKPNRQGLQQAIDKASIAYGKAIRDDLAKAIERSRERRDWLDRCMLAMGMTIPKAVLWQNIRALQQAAR
jgi:hypothetical protein